ncbi:MAG: pyridoxal 5'-phosphate synthase glutaminase subunit PdxT [Eubacterium sp.]
MVIGILALQGAFAEHQQMLDQLKVQHFEIRQKKDLEKEFDALIIPGGESTVIGKLLHELDLFEILHEKIQEGLPVWGTCAGLILLARHVDGGVPCFGTMNISVKRNAFGRQLGSFNAEKEFKGIGTIPMAFIRAPYIVNVDSNVEVLAEVDGKIVAARQGKQLVTAFHPEVTNDLRVHKYFIDLV